MEKVVVKKVYTFDELRPEVREKVIDSEREYYYNHIVGDEIDMFIENYEIPEHLDAHEYVTNVEKDFDIDGERVHTCTFEVNTGLFFRKNIDKFKSPVIKNFVHGFLDPRVPAYSEIDKILVTDINTYDWRVTVGRHGVANEVDIFNYDTDTEAWEDWEDMYERCGEEKQDLLSGMLDELRENIQEEVEAILSQQLILVNQDIEDILSSIHNKPDEDFIEMIRDSERNYFDDGEVAPFEYSYLDLESARNLKVLRSQIEPDGKNRSIREFVGGV